MDRQDSIDFITKSNQWPRWPILPVVNRRRIREHLSDSAGLIHMAAPTTIRLGNMYNMDQEKWDTAEQLHFESIEALVDAGWEPD